MKKMMAVLLALVLALLPLGGCASTGGDVAQARLQVVASFYPMALLTERVTEGVPGVALHTMAQMHTGCLHDYQLQPRDMKILENADVLVYNGAGMEGFIGRIAALEPGLKLIEASDGQELLESAAHEHEHEDEHEAHEEHYHGDANAHLWLSPKRAMAQVENIRDGLMAADPEYAQVYRENAQTFLQELEQLDGQVATLMAPCQGQGVVTFHEGFTYLLEDYGLHQAGLLQTDDENAPSPRYMAELIDHIRQEGIGALFCEKQYSTRLAEAISRETGAKIYTLDTIVSGPGGQDAYANAVLQNAQTISEALKK